MKQISILKNNVVTNGPAQFETDEALQEWLSYHEGLGTFGQKAFTEVVPVETSPAILAEDGTVLQEATFVDEIRNHEGYEVVIEDLTAQLAQEAINAEAQKFLNETDWKVLRHQDQQALGIATSLTAEEFQDLLQQRQMARSAIIRT